MTVHNEFPKTLQDVKKCSTHYEEALFTCKVCSRSVKHEIKNIACHVQTHCKSLDDYADKYLNIHDELDKLPVITDSSNEKHTDEKLLLSNGDEKEGIRRFPDLPSFRQDSQVPNSEKKLQSSPSLNEKPSNLVRHDNVSELITPKPKEPKKEYNDEFLLRHDKFVSSVPLSEVNRVVISGKQSEPFVEKTFKQVKKAKPISMYHCPISNCKFITTKEGMKNSEAAIHLKNEHGIKAADMKPGMYKFEKIKKLTI